MRHTRGRLISAVLGTQLPRPDSFYLGQDLNFIAPVKRIIKLRTTALNQRGEMAIDGTAVVKKAGL